MKHKTIKELEELYKLGELKEEQIEALKEDPRKGVQKIIAAYKKEQQKQEDLIKKFHSMHAIENKLKDQGYSTIAGVDEAGRGPLAGPVVAAAVILPSTFKGYGLTDSKQLTDEERLHFFDLIASQCIDFKIAVVGQKKIDEINILNATKQAMKQALIKLNPSPSFALIDAVHLEDLPFPSDTVIKGDERSISIAAASVIAKVTRDRLMDELHKQFPQYHFHKNKGYGTAYHLKMLKELGASPIHRRSFTPVKQRITDVEEGS